ncbi:MAG: hypothetical protein CVV50_04230 [Spirochaetae bacterium HGW-Spirochaetae-6]|nr:MAG: hypothetical protein CVV50_04230 [Spirochaetae bacterium HGW-Spirochaetae-6]
MKKNLKKIVILLSALLSLGSCSHMVDALWNPNAASFNIDAEQDGAIIKISFSRNDHTNFRSNGDVSESSYFWGYYVYRNSSSPYDDYNLIGITGLVRFAGNDGNGQSFYFDYIERVLGESDVNPDPNPIEFEDTSCNSGIKYFYRVVVVYREWDKDAEEWLQTLSDQDASSWAAAVCP